MGSRDRNICRDLEEASERQLLLGKQDLTVQKSHCMDYNSSSTVCHMLVNSRIKLQNVVHFCVVQAVMFLVTVLAGSEMLTPSNSTLKTFGATYGPDIRNGEVWRLITPLFLHASILHLVFNLFIILHLGLNIEESYGISTMVFLYFVSGIWGNLLTVAVNPCVLAVGASTSGFGIFGCILTEVCLAWDELNEDTRRRYGYNALLLLLLVVLLSCVPSIDMWGHIGGFIAGVAITLFINQEERKAHNWGSFVLYGLVIILVLILIAFIVVVWYLPLPCMAFSH